jgi:hypothetical protein
LTAAINLLQKLDFGSFRTGTPTYIFLYLFGVQKSKSLGKNILQNRQLFFWPPVLIKEYIRNISKIPDMIKKGRLLLLFTVVFFTSCELAKVEDPIIVPDVDDEFYIDWRENLSPTQRTLQLVIRTIKAEQCPDASISYNFSRLNLGYRISLNDIVASDECDEPNQPASAEIPMGYVGRGTYQIEIDLKNSVSNEGTLQAYTDSYSLDMRSEYGIQILEKVLHKVPEHAVWGYFNFDKIEDEEVVEALLNELSEMGVAQTFDEGYYGHFRIGSTGQIALADQPISSRLKTFIFSIPGQEDALNAFVEKVRDQYGENIELVMYDDTGRNY